MEELLSCDVSEIDLFCKNGQEVKIPSKGMEKEFINERWVICRGRNDRENKKFMENVEECYYKNNDQSDDEKNDKDLSEKSMNKKSRETILYEWRKYRYNISITRSMRRGS